MTFQFDTSSAVDVSAFCEGGTRYVWWTDLDAFTQGYIEGVKQAYPILYGDGFNVGDRVSLDWGFSDLAPETLARIMADCARFQAASFTSSFKGRDFWENRQAPWHTKGARQGNQYWDLIADFPPLTPYLGEDGKVYLREAV